MHTAPEEDIEAVSTSVLYEGFLLYPYRLSALKNQQRWSFGVLYPPSFSVSHHEPDMAQTECLLEGAGSATMEVRVRLLQLDGESVVERSVRTGSLSIGGLPASAYSSVFRFGEVEAVLQVATTHLGGSLFKASARLSNLTSFVPTDREEALPRSLISAHLLLSVKDGRFFSMIDPPEEIRDEAAECRNVGFWPVLAGKDDSHVLAAPLILYDHPRIAPQSPGDLFDGTEIDELLTLRISTLTDEEKREMVHADLRTKTLLERTEGLTKPAMLNLHGTLDKDEPFAPGDRVRLRPRTGSRTRTDILDLVLEGGLATVLSVEQDFEGRSYVCVALEADPGKDLGAEGKPGHRFFFAPDEVELVGP